MIQNRKARFEYTILEEYKAGICLIGSEVKSIRLGKANISDAYCTITDGEVFIRNMHIDHYEQSHVLHEVKRERKLLLTKKEIKKISDKIEIKGLSLIALSVEDGKYIKVNIAIGKGKKKYEKRETIKKKDIERELKRVS